MVPPLAAFFVFSCIVVPVSQRRTVFCVLNTQPTLDNVFDIEANI